MHGDEVRTFLEPLINLDDKQLERDVIKLQNSFTTSPYREYPSQIELDHNVAEYIAYGSDLETTPTKYSMSLPDIRYLQQVHKEQRLDEWYSMLFYRNKQGWGKAIIKNGETIVLR